MERKEIITVSPENENLPEQKIAEKLIRDLKPVLLTSRFFGLTPLSITKTNLSISKILLTVFGIFHISSYYFFFGRLQAFYNYNNLETKAKILSIAFLIMSNLCIHIDSILCILHNRKLHVCLNHIMFYDKATKYENESNYKFVAWSWTILFVIGILATSIGGLTYQFDIEPVNNAIFYCTGCIFLALAISKFLVVVVILLIRFRHLNRTMMKDWSSVTTESENTIKILDLQEAWQLHGYLSVAAENLSSMYSMQLFLWIVGFTFNAITQIYTCGTEEYSSVYYQIREYLLLILVFAILIALTTVCHVTASEANKMGVLLFSSKYFRRDYLNYEEDCFAIGQYFLLKSFHFSAGVFNINLPLLLTISSAITTYLVILMAPGNC